MLSNPSGLKDLNFDAGHGLFESSWCGFTMCPLVCVSWAACRICISSHPPGHHCLKAFVSPMAMVTCCIWGRPYPKKRFPLKKVPKVTRDFGGGLLFGNARIKNEFLRWMSRSTLPRALFHTFGNAPHQLSLHLIWI